MSTTSPPSKSDPRHEERREESPQTPRSSPSPDSAPLTDSVVATATSNLSLNVPSPTTSYISPASSQSPTTNNNNRSGAAHRVSAPGTPNNHSSDIQERATIDSAVSTMILRKDSDDASFSKLQPVHNFFQQHFNPYDSDGSDGSLIFSPTPTDDHQHKTTVSGITSSRFTSGTSAHKRKDSTANRERTHSTDSVASNGSIKYVKTSKSATPQSLPPSMAHQQPIDINNLPYHERRKLMKQREEQQRYQQQQQQQQQQMQQVQQQYHYAMMMQAQQQMAQQQDQLRQQQSLHPAHAYPMDPRMAAAYYQMYGLPPLASDGSYPTPHNSGSPPSMYPFPPPQQQQQLQQQQQGPAYMAHPQHQQYSSGSGYMYPYAPYQHQYPAFPANNAAQSVPGASYPYMPGLVLPQPQNHQPTSVQSDPYRPQQEQHHQQEPQQQSQQQQLQHASTSTHVRQGSYRSTGKQDRLRGSNSATQSSAQPSIPPGSAKNPPRPPTSGTSGSGKPPSHRIINSMGSIPPPPPPPPPPGHVGISSGGPYHMRADSHGSWSSMGSLGAGGISGLASSSSKDEDDGPVTSSMTVPPPPHPGTHSSLPVDMVQNLSQPAPPTPKVDRHVSTSIDDVPTPETPREVAHSRKHSFLDRLRMNWSPQSRDTPTSSARKKADIGDFHRQNQEFLHKATIAPTFSSSKASTANEHRRLSSHDRPPASRGTHRRLPSISNDSWEEESELETSGDDRKLPAEPRTGSAGTKHSFPGAPINPPFGPAASEETSESGSYLDDERYTDDSDGFEDVIETTSLLPPTGISTNEKDEKDSKYVSQSRYNRQVYGAAGQRHQRHLMQGSNKTSSSMSTTKASDELVAVGRGDNPTSKLMRKSRKKKYRRMGPKQERLKGNESSSDSSSSESLEQDADYRQWTKKRARMLEKERSRLIEQWKAEARADAEKSRREEQSNIWYRRLWRATAVELDKLASQLFGCLTSVEAFIGNLPLTICAVAMAIVTLGVVWFKFAEEYLDYFDPVNFHSSQCTFPEFPGCFYCDENATGYKIAITFHYGCKVVSGLIAMLVVAKIVLASRVVMDEMSSPTTSSPAGLLCMTSVCVFAGRGLIGQIIVSAAACIHLALAIWFIYMALAYHIMPEPSWFPNTIGIGISAVKTWLYYPMPGHLLMAISLSLNFFFFPISLIRVAVNRKISATVGWMQMGAPAISLYALTIMAQPSFEEEHPDVTNFQRVHRIVYLPCMHVMCALSILGMAASVHSLYVRWPDFRNKEFSPAHAAFFFPTLSHANAIQAYRGAVLSFSDIPPRTWRMFILDTYWFIVLAVGTIATFWICGKFIAKLPEWTSPDLSDEDEPPAPYDTLLSRQDMVTAGDALTQPFVSPAILQANETGALILTRARDGSLRYVRTRRIRALGFEPTMNWSEMQEEREVLLEWVGKHPPRRRHRTLSVPGIDFSYGASLGTGNSGVYHSSFSPAQQSRRRFMSHGGDNPSVFY